MQSCWSGLRSAAGADTPATRAGMTCCLSILILASLWALQIAVNASLLPRYSGFLQDLQDNWVPWAYNMADELFAPCPWTSVHPCSVRGDCPSTSNEASVNEPPRYLGIFLDLKFYFGFIMWALAWWTWLLWPFGCRHKAVQALSLKVAMAMGFNLTALSSVQCDNALGFYWPFMMNVANSALVLIRFPSSILPDKDEIEINGATCKCRKYTARCVYEDLTYPWPQMCLIFVSQVLLTAVVVVQSYAKYVPDSVNPGFWFMGCVCVQLAKFLGRGADSEVGLTWPLERFRGLIAINDSAKYQHKEQDPEPDWTEHETWELHVRFWMGFLVNALLRDIVIFITPLIFMQSEDGMDFVQNVFALAFIPVMDDLGDGKDVWIHRRLHQTSNYSWHGNALNAPLIHEHNPEPDQPDRNNSWNDQLGSLQEDLHQAARQSPFLEYARRIMFAVPLAVWMFGMCWGLHVQPPPAWEWWIFLCASFWLDLLYVVLMMKSTRGDSLRIAFLGIGGTASDESAA